MEEQANNTVTQSADVEPEKQDSAQSEKTFSQAEVDAMVQSRLAREKEKMSKSLRTEIEEDVRNQIKNEESEANKLKKMDEDQRRKYELDKRDQEIKELKAKLNRSEMEHVATDLLSKKGIVADSDTLKFVVAEDAEATQANIECFADLINQKAQANRREDFDVPEPRSGNNNSTSPVTKEEFRSMDYHEKLKLKERQPTAYKQLVASLLGGS